MTDPNRIMPIMMSMLTHDQGMKDCGVGTTVSVATVDLGNRAYVSVTMNNPEFPVGFVQFLDREKAEAMIELIWLAMDDADRINAGGKPLAMEYDQNARLN